MKVTLTECRQFIDSAAKVLETGEMGDHGLCWAIEEIHGGPLETYAIMGRLFQRVGYYEATGGFGPIRLTCLAIIVALSPKELQEMLA